jgi:hypothetical protein
MSHVERSAGDSLRLYLREFGRTALLSAEEEQACALRKLRRADAAAALRIYAA